MSRSMIQNHSTWIYGLWSKSWYPCLRWSCSPGSSCGGWWWQFQDFLSRCSSSRQEMRENQNHIWDNNEWIGGDTKAWQATCQGGGGLGWEGDWCRGMEKGGYDVLVVVTISLWYQVIQLTFLCRLTMPALSYTSPVSPLYQGKPVLTFFFYWHTQS